MTLNQICQQTMNPALLNALHACRPNHPWNRTTKQPFTNALFLAKQQGYFKRLSHEAEAWLEARAKEEGA